LFVYIPFGIGRINVRIRCSSEPELTSVHNGQVVTDTLRQGGPGLTRTIPREYG
jgi:hypothetical protein